MPFDVHDLIPLSGITISPRGVAELTDRFDTAPTGGGGVLSDAAAEAFARLLSSVPDDPQPTDTTTR